MNFYKKFRKTAFCIGHLTLFISLYICGFDLAGKSTITQPETDTPSGVKTQAKNSWELTNGPDAVGKLKVFATNLFINGNHGLYKSVDNGDTWITVYKTENYISNYFFNNKELILTIYKQADSTNLSSTEIFSSLDTGVTWKKLDLNFYGHSIRFYEGLDQYLGVIGGFSDDTVFLFSGQNKKQIFADGIAFYTEIKIFDFASFGSNLLMAVNKPQNKDALQRSVDGGNTWIEVPFKNLDKGFRFLTFQDQNTIFCKATNSYGDAIFRSDNFGLTWTEIGGNLPVDKNIYDFTVHNSKYFLALRTGIFISEDLGVNWKRLGDFSPYIISPQTNLAVNDSYIFMTQWGSPLRLKL